MFRSQGGENACPEIHQQSLDQTFEHLFVDLSGKRPASSGGHDYLMMIAEDFSRLGWACFLKENSDVPAVFAGFLTFGHRATHPL